MGCNLYFVIVVLFANELLLPGSGLDITTAKLRSGIGADEKEQPVFVIRDPNAASGQGRQEEFYGPFYAPLNFLLYPLTLPNPNAANKDETEKEDVPQVPTTPTQTALNLLQSVSQMTGFPIAPSFSSLVGIPSASGKAPEKESSKPKPLAAEGAEAEVEEPAEVSSEAEVIEPAPASPEATAVEKGPDEIVAEVLPSAETTADADKPVDVEAVADIEEKPEADAEAVAVATAVKRIAASSSDETAQVKILSLTLTGSQADKSNIFSQGWLSNFGLWNQEPTVINITDRYPNYYNNGPDAGQRVCDHACQGKGSGVLDGDDCYCNCHVSDCCRDTARQLCRDDRQCSEYCYSTYRQQGIGYRGPLHSCQSGFCVCKCDSCAPTCPEDAVHHHPFAHPVPQPHPHPQMPQMPLPEPQPHPQPQPQPQPLPQLHNSDNDYWDVEDFDIKKNL